VFEGLAVALVTPFKGGEIDLDGMGRLVEHLLEGGVQTLVVSGSTGEAATCSVEERRTLWSFIRDRAKGRAPVVAGTGTNSTADSIALTHMAEEIGLDGAMVVTPFYNKPTARGQIAHFTAVARAAKLPIILYNVPGRTATNTLPDTFAAVQGEANIVAIKEASGNLDQTSSLVAGTRYTVLSGDDSLTVPMISVGAKGLISVAGNAAPAAMRQLCDHALAGRTSEASAAHAQLMPIFKGLFAESNPGPVKYLLSQMGIIENELRLPLVPVEPATEKIVMDAARAARIPLAAASTARA
jgi:4-hydroxy-tetrahydrodipicolinate synthase